MCGQLVIFKVDRLQIILVAKKYISTCRNCSSVGCLAKMRAIPQLVSAPLNPIPIAEHFRHPTDKQLRHVDIYFLATKIICSPSTLNVLAKNLHFH